MILKGKQIILEYYDNKISKERLLRRDGIIKFIVELCKKLYTWETRDGPRLDKLEFAVIAKQAWTGYRSEYLTTI